jgi:hypothetical protein
MAEKKQWGIRIEDQLIERLTTLAPQAGYSSANEFVADALDCWAETLKDLMIELRKNRQGFIEQRREQLLSQIRSQGQESGTKRRK